MVKKYYVKNGSIMQGVYNLPSMGNKGKRLSLILSRNEVSRPLTEEEFKSPEIQKALKSRDLLDVSRKFGA